MKKILMSLTMLVLSACTTTATGPGLSPEGQAALEISVSIAMRHYLADDPRAMEKARHVRDIAARLQTIVTATSTMEGLTKAAIVEVDKLSLSPLERADAVDLITILGAVLEARIGTNPIDQGKLVEVRKFLALIIAAVPGG